MKFENAKIRDFSIKAVMVGFWFVAVAFTSVSSAVSANPLSSLHGSWGGGGTFALADGTKTRISCNAYYSGSGSQLRMVIRCRGDNNKIEIRSQLSHNAGSLSGNWEERTYNAQGSASGSVTGSKLRLRIAGSGISASMNVSFSRASQKVSLSVSGVALKKVNIKLRRQ